MRGTKRKNRVAMAPGEIKMAIMNDNSHFQLVADSLEWIVEHQPDQPGLAELAGAMRVSPHYLQRTFQAWAGISPKQFLKSLTREAALRRLAAGDSTLDAALASGLSGPGRLHDLVVSTEAITPGQASAQGLGVTFHFGYGPTPFGKAMIAWTERGIAFLGFCGPKSAEQVRDEFTRKWNRSKFERDEEKAIEWLHLVFSGCSEKALPVWLRGSPFQLKVWEALLAIPDGANVTYGRLARAIGKPGASQAVGNAVGANPVSWIIPCHRVIKQLGEIGGYRWGQPVKFAMIGYESSRFSPQPER